MKMKMLVAAVTMAVAGGANAAYVGSSNTTTGSSLMFWAYDSTNANNGFVADLGETFSTFGLSHPSATWNISGALSTISAANLVWGVGAGNQNIKTGIYTSQSASFPQKTGPNQTALVNMETDVSGLNNDGCGTTCATARVGGLTWGNNWGVFAPLNTGAAVDGTMNFFQVKGVGTNTTNATVTKYDGTWNFNSAGTLSYSVASSAPVPVPAAAWLLGSALVGMVGVARRKREAQA